ncbi:MAG: GNAT family N-acetyltransferase [Bacillota bacterium]|nr:GNAT family N-acetyltransferase [Bacillota bacterium]
MIIRNITEADAENFLNFLRTMDTETEFMMFEPGERSSDVNDIREKIKEVFDSASIMLVLEDDARIVGFISADRGFANRIRHSAYIVIGLLRKYRGMGCGTRLLQEVDKWAVRNGISRLELTVLKNNETAIRLYKKIGYKIEGIKEKSLKINGDYIDEYYMAKLFD